MCLAIYKPAETKPDWQAYENGYENNSDGWGFAVVENGELLDCVGIGDFAEFRRNFEPFAHCPAIIHFRWATHGTKGPENCHPFVHRDLAMIHNGIVSIDTADDKDRSDTYHFMQKVVVPMYDRDPDFFLRNEVVYNMELAHAGSKFAFLRADGTVAIWNKDDGVEENDGHWYSNNGYLSCRRWYLASDKDDKCAAGFRGWSDRWERYYDAASSRSSLQTTSAAAPASSAPVPETTADEADDSVSLDEHAIDEFASHGMTLMQSDDPIGDTLEIDDLSDDAYSDAYRHKLCQELYDWGLSKQTILEVREAFGWTGLEALWDAR